MSKEELAEKEKIKTIKNFIKEQFGNKITSETLEDLIDGIFISEALVEEFLYYIEHKDFVPKRNALSYKGYTVEEIYKKTDFLIPEAFSCMGMLIENGQSFFDFFEQEYILEEE